MPKILSTPPNLTGKPDNQLFVKNDFESAIWQKGYSVVIEKAIQCPCKGKSGAAKTTCQNCLGLGWLFIQPLETKALITSANSQTKYRYWSPEITGTINVTVRDKERLAFMDKITFNNNTSVLSEVKELLEEGEVGELERFIFLSYKAKTITDVYYFDSDTTTLRRISGENFSINPYNKCVLHISTDLVFPAGFNGVLTIRYEHEVSYNVVDIPHDFRSTFVHNNMGQNVESHMPIQAVARRSHIVLGEPTNFDGNNMLVNE